MMIVEKRFQEGPDSPKYYCPSHGVLMTVKPRKAYNLITGIEEVTGFESRCPRWFCRQSILTGVVGLPPRVVI